MEEARRPPNHVIVIFGGNGDLARRKLLPALYHLEEAGLMPDDYRIIGNSRRPFSTEEFQEFARGAVEEFGGEEIDEQAWKRLSTRLDYASHDFKIGDTGPLKDAVDAATAELGDEVHNLFYLSVPPTAFAPLTEAIGESGMNEGARVVYEKPFGIDLSSFKELEATVRSVLDESQVFTIDHFLGKETVQNILALRFANGMFEPSWNRHHVDHVQIDVPEKLGLEGRAGFYETVGAFRDMVVTHLFQVMSYIAMEPPATFEPKFLHNEAVKVFESMLEVDPDDVVRGQYAGYRDEEGVAPDSDTDTFAAARVWIDNWRWAGVPFYLRTGKRMAERRSTVTLAFKEPPRQMFKEIETESLDNDHLTLELGPDEGMSITFLAKLPGPDITLAPASMKFAYEGAFKSEAVDAYERLLHDALMGDSTLFTRGDGIERVWEVVQPILDKPPPVLPYEPGSWGPEAAEELIAPRHWHLPAHH